MYTRIFSLTFALCLLWSPHASAGIYPEDAVDRLAAAGLTNLENYLGNQTSAGKCTLETAVKRREWYIIFHNYGNPVGC